MNHSYATITKLVFTLSTRDKSSDCCSTGKAQNIELFPKVGVQGARHLRGSYAGGILVHGEKWTWLTEATTLLPPLWFCSGMGEDTMKTSIYLWILILCMGLTPYARLLNDSWGRFVRCSSSFCWSVLVMCTDIWLMGNWDRQCNPGLWRRGEKTVTQGHTERKDRNGLWSQRPSSKRLEKTSDQDIMNHAN